MKTYRNILFIVGVLLVLPHFSNAQVKTEQEDTVQHIDAVRIERRVIKDIKMIKIRSPKSYLDLKAIKELATEDAGEVISKLSGVNLKSYGGLGGLKTVSMRAMGTQHTSIVIDGFSVTNDQTGQVNLGQIQSDNLISAVAISGDQASLLAPISSQAAGSLIYLSTFENSFGKDTLALRANARYGSFNQQNAYLSTKYSKGGWMLSAFGKYRKADGEYAYSYMNGNTPVNAVRANNDYQDQYFGAVLGYSFKEKYGHLRSAKKRINYARLGYSGGSIDQGLPGAVIFYNETADERLVSNNHSVFGDLNFDLKKKAFFRFYAKAKQNKLNYIDPDFLNNTGGIDVTYTNQELRGGVSFIYDKWSKFELSAGMEQSMSGLVSTDTLFSEPVRFQNYGMVGGNYQLPFGILSTQLFSQFVNEENRTNESSEDQFRLNPFVSFTTKMKNKWSRMHTLWYRNSFRMPSFNELYYNNIGNTGLLPETTHQFNYGYEIVPWDKIKGELYLRSNLFFNRVNNKIVAIPTKNLFVWSLQNVTDVNIFGGEFIYTFKLKLKKIELKSEGNYTFQRAIDMTDGSLNKGHQIAYTPMHTANLDVSIYWKSLGARFSNNFVSKRYALNENIASNEVNAFLSSDISIFYNLKLKKKNELRIQGNIKNLFNQSYAYVRSFIMPGRNYLITLSYAFN